MMKLIISSAILISVVFAVDLYIFQAIKVNFQASPPKIKRAVYIGFWCLSALSIVFLLSGPRIYFAVPDWFKPILTVVIMGFILGKLFLVLFLFTEDLFRGIKWVVAKVGSNEHQVDLSRKKFVSTAGIIAAFIPFTTMMYGMFRNAYRYRIHKHTIKLANLPASFDGLKIIQLSDIHSGSFNKTEPLIEAVDMINSMEPDLVLFTGDLVNSVAKEMEPYVEIFGKLKGKIGVYSCTGNHDYGDYHNWSSDEEKAENFHRFTKMHKEMGWRLLLDENEILEHEDGSLAVIGIQNSSSSGFKTYGDLPKAYRGAEDADVKVLLSHDPSFWDGSIRKDFPDIDLTLSGHTHGAQFGIETGWIKWSPVKYMYKQWAGLYKTGKQYINVNRGFGFIAYHGRIGILPEITEITLKKA